MNLLFKIVTEALMVSTVVVVKRSLGLIVLASVNQYCSRNALTCNKAQIASEGVAFAADVACRKVGFVFFLVFQNSSVLAWILRFASDSLLVIFHRILYSLESL